MNIDRRQFIICQKRLERENFLCMELEEGYYLYYHKDLQVQKLGDDILLGHAFSVHADYPVMVDSRYSLEEQIRRWGGRFLVYSHGRIYTDATNSLGLFYIWEDGLRVVSSSVHLLVTEYQVERTGEFELLYRSTAKTWDYYPGPYTPYERIKRLMQYERLDLSAEEFVKPDTCRWNISGYENLSIEEKVQRFIEYAVYMLREIQKEYDGIYVPLTGGVDSRLICALCKKAGVSFTAYTEKRSYETHGSFFSKADGHTPKKIAGKLGIDWVWCQRKSWDENRWQEVLEHSMGMVRNSNLYSYAYDQYPQGKNKNIILHGSVFGVSNEVYAKGVNENCSELKQQKESLHRWLHVMMKSSDVHQRSIDKWVEDIQDKGNQDMGWVNRFYYEQRIGSWLNDINQAMDLIDFDRISLANNYEMISLLFSFPKEMRRDKKHEIMMMEQLAPEFLSIPFNQEYLSEKMARKTKRLKRKLKGGYKKLKEKLK